MHKSMQQFVARLSWFLAAMMTLIVMAIPTVVQAQQPAPSTPAEEPAKVILVERQSFARVYAGIIDGIAPSALEACTRLGQSCPTPHVLTRPAREYTPRTLRQLEGEVGGAAFPPGEIALQIQRVGALSVRCLLDTTIGSTPERRWTRVRLSEDRVRRHPWHMGRWLSHRCKAQDIRVRPGHEILYTMYLRDAERRVHDFVALHAPSTTPTDPVVINDAVRALLTHLPPDGNSLSAAVLLPLVRKLVELIHAKPIPVATQSQIVYRVPAGYVPMSHFEKITRNWMALCLVVVSLAFMATAFLHFRYKGSLQDLAEKWQGKSIRAQEAFLQRLQEVSVAEFARGRADGISTTGNAFSSVANFLLSSILGTSLQEHPGTVKERFDQIFEKWNEYLPKVENRGRTKAEEAFATREKEIRAEERRAAVATLRDTLSALAARLSLSLSPIPDGEVPAVATAIEALVTGLEQKGQEAGTAAKTAARPVAVTRGFGESPGRDTPESLSLRQARDAADLLKYIRTLAAEDDPRREVGWERPDVIAVGKAILQDVVIKFRTREERAEHIVVDFTKHLHETVSLLTGSPLEKSPVEKGISDFGLGSALRSLREVLKTLRGRVQETIQDARVAGDAFWNDPPDNVKAIVDRTLAQLPPDDPRHKIVGYQLRAQTALVVSTSEITLSPVW